MKDQGDRKTGIGRIRETERRRRGGSGRPRDEAVKGEGLRVDQGDRETGLGSFR